MSTFALRPDPFAAAPAALEHQVDDAKRRVTFRVAGEVPGWRIRDLIVGLFTRRPELTGYDLVFDLRESRTDAGPTDIEPIAEIYARAAGPVPAPSRTAFVTADMLFTHWAQVMDHQFPNRRHRVVPTFEAAEAFLREGR